MVAKRERSPSPASDASGSDSNTSFLPSDMTPPSTPKTPKRPKGAKTQNFNTKASGTKTPKAKGDSPTKARATDVITTDMKHTMMVAAMNLAYKGLQFEDFAKEFGISASRLKDQFKHGRFNLRQKAILSANSAGKEDK